MSDIEIIHNILLTSRQMLRETGSEPTPEGACRKTRYCHSKRCTRRSRSPKSRSCLKPVCLDG